MKGEARPSRRGRVPLGAVCTTVAAKTSAKLAEKAARALSLGTDLVELRVDLLAGIEMQGLAPALAPLAGRSVLTVRRREEGGGFAGGESERLALIAEPRGPTPPVSGHRAHDRRGEPPVVSRAPAGDEEDRLLA